MSHLSRVCGLKWASGGQFVYLIPVTPFTGVWIEIESVCKRSDKHVYIVTPFTGVWIEIGGRSAEAFTDASHLSRVCGLKFRCRRNHPPPRCKSHLSRVCGLKYHTGWVTAVGKPSHLSRVCGLKLLIACALYLKTLVTPFTGVWIEIILTWMMHIPQFVTPFTGVWIEIR